VVTGQPLDRLKKRAVERVAAGNWDCFGAPATLFCYVDRGMRYPQWADVDMYLQRVTFVSDT
jgi:hypothetical protein